MLLVGSDSRAFVDTPGECLAYSVAGDCKASDAGGQRSDVTILVRVVPATHQIEMLSIPRDTWVAIPGHVPYISGENRINGAEIPVALALRANHAADRNTRPRIRTRRCHKRRSPSAGSRSRKRVSA